MNRHELVLLHGWGLTPRVWDHFAALLPPAIRVHAPALPGHESPAVAHATLAGWADALAVEVPPGAALCGWSLGGLLALELARRHPAKVSRVVLIGSTPRFVAAEDGTWTHGLDAGTVAGFTAGFADDPVATLRRFVALQGLHDENRRIVAAALTAALADPPASAALADGLRLLAQSDLRGALAAIHQPVLLLHGAGDALMPVAAAEWLAAQLARARLTRLDGCGHAPFLSRPADCARRISEFVLG